MIAEYKKTKTADGLALTFGKMYKVIDLKTGSRRGQVKEIKIKNDLGCESWYKANKFILFAEAAAYLKEPAAAGAGQGAAQSATPDGSQIFVETAMMYEADRAAGITAREIAEIGKEIAKGLADGLNMMYGA